MNRTLIVYSSSNMAPTDLLNGTNDDATHFRIVSRYNNNTDYLIDRGEKFEIMVNVSSLDTIGVNQEFQVEVKPPQGATYTIHRKAPAAISAIMTLV
jgi:flagellin FlaB